MTRRDSADGGGGPELREAVVYCLPLSLLACAHPGADAPPDPDPVIGEGVTLGAVQVCIAPSPSPSWVDRAPEWGLLGPASEVNHFDGGGITLDDYDFDGDLDLLLFFENLPPWDFRWNEDHFDVDVIPYRANSGKLFDIDQDGRRDLLLESGQAGWAYANGDGWDDPGTDMIVGAEELLPEGAIVRDFSPGDLDGDGDLEIYTVLNSHSWDVGDTTLRDFVLGQGPDGTWASIVPLAPDVAGRAGFDAAWLDADEDGWLDVFVGNDTEHVQGQTLLLHNDGNGGLEDWTDACTCSMGPSVMGVTVADLNDDDHEDVFISAALGAEGLMLGQGDGSFVNAAAALGATLPPVDEVMDWGNTIVDVDNDGLRDIVVTEGDIWGLDWDPIPATDNAVALLQQQRDGSFEDVTVAMGFPVTGSWRSVLARDMNADGVVDLLLTQVADMPTWLVSTGCTDGNWLDIDTPEGAWVEVRADGRWQRLRATTDLGYQVSAPPRVHVGLGQAVLVEELRVTLLDGSVRSATNFAPRRVVTVN